VLLTEDKKQVINALFGIMRTNLTGIKLSWANVKSSKASYHPRPGRVKSVSLK
jgi:hypothetical protein